MSNADDTKPIDLDAIDTMLPDILRRCALVLADPRSEAGQTSTDLAHAVQAMAPLLTEVRRLASIVARRTRGKRPKLPDDGFDVVLDESIEACRIVGIDILGDYDYLGTLRRLVRERNAAQADLERVTTERDEVFGESLVACAILGADPTAPGYDYLETLRAVVKERKDAVDAFHRCRVERDAANTERDEVRAFQAEQRAFVEGLELATRTARAEGQQAERARVAAFLGKQAEQAAAKGQEVGADAFAWAADRVRDGRYLPVGVVAQEAHGLNGDVIREWPPEVFASWFGSVTMAIAEAGQEVATARIDGARAMRNVVVDRLLADPAMLSLANEIGAFDPATVAAEPES